MLWFLLFAVLAVLASTLVFAYSIVQSRAGTPDINPDGKPVLVTGAASGIGKATCELLLSRGAFVYAADLSTAKLNTLFGSNKNVLPLELDVTKPASVDAAVKLIEQQGRGLYGLVNCAGVLCAPGQNPLAARGVVEMDVDVHVRPVLEVNLLGTMRVTAAVRDMLLESRGAIVNLASVAGRVAFANGPYCISKWGVNAYSAVMRRELRDNGVRVVAVEPGFTRTAMTSPYHQARLDLSNTKLAYVKRANARMAKSKLNDERTWQPASAVADEVYNALFSSVIETPHVVVDYAANKLKYVILSSLPHTWQDAIWARQS